MISARTIWWMSWTILYNYHLAPDHLWFLPGPTGECPGLFLYNSHLVPGHWRFLWIISQTISVMSWTIIHIAPSCSGISVVPVNHFPDHPVNVLDYFLIITILFQAKCDSYELFPRPSCQCCGLFSYNYHLALGHPWFLWTIFWTICSISYICSCWQQPFRQESGTE